MYLLRKRERACLDQMRVLHSEGKSQASSQRVANDCVAVRAGAPQACHSLRDGVCCSLHAQLSDTACHAQTASALLDLQCHTVQMHRCESL